MDATLFRNAAIQFGKCTSWSMEYDDGNRVHSLENQMMCPCCKDFPRVLIMDETSMNIRSRACFADSITLRSCESMKDCLKTRAVPSGTLSQLSKESPVLFKLLLAIKCPGDSHVKIPVEWDSLVN